MPKHKYIKGALVFAKVKGYPPWPARITGLGSKDRYKVYFYGTYETATLRSEDIWPYNPDTKEKFATKNMKRKGYSEGIDQIENTPEIAMVEGELSDLDTTADISLQSPLVISEPAPAPAKKPAKSTPAGKSTPASKAKETPKTAEPTPKSAVRTSKRKASEVADGETPAKRAAAAVGPADENGESEEKFSRSGRAIKPKKLGVGAVASPKPAAPADGDTEKAPGKSLKKETEKTSPVKLDPSEPRKMWVKVKDTDDVIEINLDKDRPESFSSNEAKLEWEMASARKALKFKRRVESGEFVPPEIKKKLEEREAMSEEDKAVQGKEKLLEKRFVRNCYQNIFSKLSTCRKTKLKWLKIEQRLVDLDIAVKTSLHLEKPSADEVSLRQRVSVCILTLFISTVHHRPG